MEPDHARSGTMVDASGGISTNQRAQVRTFDNTSTQSPKRNITLALRPFYPLTTTHDGEFVYLGEYQANSPGNANESVFCSSRSAPFSDHHASRPTLHRNLPSPSSSDNHISKEDYERVVQENTRLTFQLEAAKQTAEIATKSCRDLAAWTIWERSRLMRELEEAKEAYRAFINDEVDQLIAEEAGHLPSK